MNKSLIRLLTCLLLTSLWLVGCGPNMRYYNPYSTPSHSTKESSVETYALDEESTMQRGEITLNTQHIALLLPISGQLAQTASSVQDGIYTAHNADTGSDRTSNITVYDTHNDTQVIETYKKAIDNGATIVIGPLTKNGTAQLNAMKKLQVPVLALNAINAKNHHVGKLFEFGLTPEDEARRAAYLAFQQGHQRALIIGQSDEWGARVRRAFKEEWHRLGGQVMSDYTYPAKSNMNDVVRQALRITLTKEQTERLTSKPQRRQDIDMIFLASYPSDARQINPLLAFYYADDLPVYATSSVYALPPNIGLDRDLNNLTFCDMPWLLSPDTAQPLLHATINELWPGNAQSNARFYALGIDAYHLVKQLAYLYHSPHYRLNGVTGALTITNDGRIERQVVCAKFQHGQPKLIY